MGNTVLEKAVAIRRSYCPNRLSEEALAEAYDRVLQASSPQTKCDELERASADVQSPTVTTTGDSS